MKNLRQYYNKLNQGAMLQTFYYEKLGRTLPLQNIVHHNGIVIT
jgi:hypothetical protein